MLQTPNTPDPDRIGAALDTIADVVPGLHSGNVSHVFGDHARQHFGGWGRSLDRTATRAGDAFSSRARCQGCNLERGGIVLGQRSWFRSDPPKTRRTSPSCLGRTASQPARRRVPGDEALNAVECILPFFDRTTAGKVVRYLTGTARRDARLWRFQEDPGRRSRIEAQLHDPRGRMGAVEDAADPDATEARSAPGDAPGVTRAGTGNGRSSARSFVPRGARNAPRARFVRHPLWQFARRTDR